MNRRVAPLLAVLVLPAVLLLLSGRFVGEAQLQELTTTIDPALPDAIGRDGNVQVLISLKPPDIPLAEQTTAVSKQHTAAVQASVLSVLTPDDFTLTYRYPISPALTGRITRSGVQRLATHPDVTAIELPAKGERLQKDIGAGLGERG